MWTTLALSALAQPHPETDLLTVAAIAATTYTTTALLHEGVGHQVFCGVGGGRPQGFSVANAGCMGVGTPGGHRWEQAGGSIANLAAGLSFGGALWAAPPDDGAAHYHLWLQTMVQLQQAGGYLMIGPWLPVGDWGDGGVFRDVDRPLAGKIAVSTAGLALTAATIPLGHGLGKPLFGGDRRRLTALTVGPWLGGSALVVTGSLLNRAGPQFAVSAATANLFGTVFLAYMPLLFADRAFVPGEPHSGPLKPIERRPAWWVVGGLSAVAAVAVFGPGVGRYEQPHPLDPAR